LIAYLAKLFQHLILLYWCLVVVVGLLTGLLEPSEGLLEQQKL
jgi:hypothetical protein